MFTRWPVYDRVLVNLVGDTAAIEGLLVDVRGRLLVLTDCVLYSPGTEPTPMDGETYIERDKVLYLQAAPAKS